MHNIEINCLIINLDYVNCTWSEPELKNNYSFKSRFTHDEIQDCPEYHRINGVNVGCVFPYKKQQRFNTLNTWLYSDNGSLVTNQEHDLKEYVKLNPPFNLTLVERKDAELWLYWNVTNNNNCIESEVRHRTDNNDWKNTSPGTRSSFSLPFPSRKKYEFQVRSRISLSCGESKFWSDWSQSVYWGSLKPNNGTEINCLIINLDYVNCTWSEPELKNNYSFKSRWFIHDEIQDCPEYHRINGVNVGCVFPYKKQQRFKTLNTWLYSDNDSLVVNQEHDLKEHVKLNPPFNLTLVERKDAELWLYWNVTNNNNCIESEVRHRTDNNDWKNTSPGTRSSFSLPFPSRKKYEFQVRSRISLSCGESKFWSDWSQSVYWGSLKPNNGTENLALQSHNNTHHNRPVAGSY
ncbi:interleukin-13 receptor subunit alpha-2-like isoform X2 [Megalobrama amblycephala]|uniref:interleukin-13 receptor subunit alpha-2-like isoform X2 n=1 Tax=Megalobrama amblycephala TaxID=75352 RepID=UPI002013E22A|nr:interleukin-13 receptor subunit alpha-2-like isoform X2 [Megalobrama amblycephala]